MVASVRPQAIGSALRMPPKAKRIGELSTVREGVASLLAHDLKTPLAAISMNLDFVLAELPSEALSGTLRSALEDCRAANARAIRILSDMADAARLQSGARHAHIADIDIQILLTAAARRVAPEAAARGLRLVWSADVKVARGDEDLLARALDRLLERALRHGRAGGTVELSLREGVITIRVQSAISEEGGTPPESAVRGLAMHFADAAMRAQGGAVWTEGEAGGTLLFCLSLPE